MDLNSIFEKISSYNIFNYFLPGVLFVVIATEMTHYNFILEDLFLGVFVYYFLGMVVSRIGSLVLKPILKFTGFIEERCYPKYIAASQKDTEIKLLSEVNNTYRSLSALFVSLVAIKLYEAAEATWPILIEWRHWIVVLSLAVVFMFAFRKQTKFVVDRIDKALSD